MYAIEFEADIQDGVVRIPEKYKSLKYKHARVVILLEDGHEESELRAMSDHSAGLVDEWHDQAEDEVWR